MATQALQVNVDKSVGEFLQHVGKSLTDYAIRKYNHTAFLKSAMIAIADNTTLRDCLKTEEGKRSLFNALRYAASTGLSLNPTEGKSCLIPYNGKIQFQIMKAGMIDLALESGKVEFITADYVKQNDTFSIEKNSNGDTYLFKPALKDRGQVLGYFAALKLKNGSTSVKWFTAEEIKEHRSHYSAKTQMPETGYGIKTVLKALLRNVSISDELANAVGTDDFFEAEFHVDRGITAEQAQTKLDAPKPKPVASGENTGSLL